MNKFKVGDDVVLVKAENPANIGLEGVVVDDLEEREAESSSGEMNVYQGYSVWFPQHPLAHLKRPFHVKEDWLGKSTKTNLCVVCRVNVGNVRRICEECDNLAFMRTLTALYGGNPGDRLNCIDGHPHVWVKAPDGECNHPESGGEWCDRCHGERGVGF